MQESTLCISEALHKHEIVGIASIDVGNAPTVANDLHLVVQTRRAKTAVGLGESPAAQWEESCA